MAETVPRVSGDTLPLCGIATAIPRCGPPPDEKAGETKWRKRMRVEIKCDIQAAILAGVEPADHVEIDVAAIDAADRPAVAYAANHRLFAAPTAAAVITAAKAAMTAAADEASAMVARDGALLAEARAALAAYAAMREEEIYSMREEEIYSSQVSVGGAPLRGDRCRPR